MGWASQSTAGKHGGPLGAWMVWMVPGLAAAAPLVEAVPWHVVILGPLGPDRGSVLSVQSLTRWVGFGSSWELSLSTSTNKS